MFIETWKKKKRCLQNLNLFDRFTKTEYFEKSIAMLELDESEIKDKKDEKLLEFAFHVI